MALKTIPTSQIIKEIERRQKAASKLQAKRDKLAGELADLDSELAALGVGTPRRGRPPGSGATAAGPRRRARNEISLPDAIAKAMELHAVVSPKEAAELVRKNGYKTTSVNFNMMVSNALAKDKRFKRVSRGQYERVK